MNKKKYPIPKYCKDDCFFRIPGKKYMPACDYAFKLEVEGWKCITYYKYGKKRDKND